jgi:hypothetical protein
VGSTERIGKLVMEYILVLIFSLPIQSSSDASMHSFCRRKTFSKSGEMPLLVFERHMPVGYCIDHTLAAPLPPTIYTKDSRKKFISKCGIKPRRVYQSTMALKL